MMYASSDRIEVDTREVRIAGLTPVAAYRALRPSGAGALMETAASTAGGTRQAIVALDPLETLIYNDDSAMLERIRALLERYRASLSSQPPGYGFICTFAYDAALTLHRIQNPWRPNRLFGDAYVLIPGTWIWFDFATDVIALTGLSRNRAERSATIDRLDDYAARLSASSARSLQAPASRTERSHSIDASLSRDAFLSRVRRAQHEIRNGEVYQVVVAIAFSMKFRGDALAVYGRFIQQNPSPCSFFVERAGRALAGASPEFLVRLHRGTAELRPLAGTRPRGATLARDAILAEELLCDVKERAEHVMLVDLGRNDLSRVCEAGSVRVERTMAIEHYSHVMHLASQVTGRLEDGRDALDLFAATFPAGTVTGTPKRRAMELIAALEPTARDLYAGSVARLGVDGSLDAGLTLRSLALSDKRAYWQAGAGIVARSEADREYAEVLAKAEIARAVLNVERADVA
ncbi:MAG: anthranilate synthase component I family protein [Candidatus Eremiobacteraeota bacterium]|nr:anthranilate synthase component I family protein [Candidatus Eremiobacteraeota bacterium]